MTCWSSWASRSDFGSETFLGAHRVGSRRIPVGIQPSRAQKDIELEGPGPRRDERSPVHDPKNPKTLPIRHRSQWLSEPQRTLSHPGLFPSRQVRQAKDFAQRSIRGVRVAVETGPSSLLQDGSNPWCLPKVHQVGLSGQYPIEIRCEPASMSRFPNDLRGVVAVLRATLDFGDQTRSEG
jgi:hypothetical protein